MAHHSCTYPLMLRSLRSPGYRLYNAYATDYCHHLGQQHSPETFMNSVSTTSSRFADREAVLHALYEAAELEHNLMCTYLYAAFSLKDGASEGLNPEEADAVARWRRTLIAVSVEEM